jgi:hypothetical protein
MEMIRQYDHRIQSVRVFFLDVTKGPSQFINMINQQVAPFPLSKIDREKP